MNWCLSKSQVIAPQRTHLKYLNSVEHEWLEDRVSKAAMATVGENILSLWYSAPADRADSDWGTWAMYINMSQQLSQVQTKQLDKTVREGDLLSFNKLLQMLDCMAIFIYIFFIAENKTE